jgi:GTPase SAR1 family protein
VHLADDELSARDNTGMAEINIALLGASGVGKSTFVQRAFGLHQIPTNTVQAVKITIARVPFNVRLLELDLDDVDLTEDERVRWPKKIEGQAMPALDGVVTLYDVTDRESLAGVPGILSMWCIDFFHPSFLCSRLSRLPSQH